MGIQIYSKEHANEISEECKRCAEFIGNNDGNPSDYNGYCKGSETGCYDFLEMTN